MSYKIIIKSYKTDEYIGLADNIKENDLWNVKLFKENSDNINFWWNVDNDLSIPIETPVRHMITTNSTKTPSWCALQDNDDGKTLLHACSVNYLPPVKFSFMIQKIVNDKKIYTISIYGAKFYNLSTNNSDLDNVLIKEINTADGLHIPTDDELFYVEFR